MSQTFCLEGQLSTQQLSFFQENGFIQFKKFIDRQQVKELLTEIDAVQRYLIAQRIDAINGIPLKFGKDTDGSLFIQRLAFTSKYSEVLRHFLRDDRFDLIRTLLQPFDGRIGEHEKDGLVVNHYLNSDDSAYTRLGWHTDSPRDLFMGSRIKPMLNVGLHLDDCPADNGGLRVIAGTHRQGMFHLLFRKKYFIDNTPDKNETAFDIEAGDLTIHDGRLWHRVQQSPHQGEASRRRVMYIPIITGAYQPKHAQSGTPFYHKLAGLRLNPNGRTKWNYNTATTVATTDGIA